LIDETSLKKEASKSPVEVTGDFLSEKDEKFI